MENIKKLLIEFLEWAEMEWHIDTFSDYEYIVDNFIKEGMAKTTPETRNCNLSDVSNNEVAVCRHPSKFWIDDKWKFFCTKCGMHGLEAN